MYILVKIFFSYNKLVVHVTKDQSPVNIQNPNKGIKINNIKHCQICLKFYFILFLNNPFTTFVWLDFKIRFVCFWCDIVLICVSIISNIAVMPDSFNFSVSLRPKVTPGH